MSNILGLKFLLFYGIVIVFFSCTEKGIVDELEIKSSDYIDSLLKVADNYRSVNVDSMLELSAIATDLAKQNDYENGYFQGVLQQGIA